MTASDVVEVGTPITTGQATIAVLRLLQTPMVGDIALDASAGHTIQRIMRNSYHLLSSGEKHLVDIAMSIHRAPYKEGARINALGGLDRTTRRKVLLILVYYHLGRDLPIGMGSEEFAGSFPGVRCDCDAGVCVRCHGTSWVVHDAG